MTADQRADAPSTAQLGDALRMRHVTMISLGGIIGAGVFVGSSTAISKGGPGVVLVYALCGGLVFLIMRMLGELAVARPGRGTFVEYTAAALGPWAGFLTGWLYWYFWVFTVGAETVAGAKLLHEAGLALPLWLTGGALVLIMTGVNLLSVRAYGELEFWFASIKVGAILAFIAVALGYVLFGRHAGLGANLTDHGGLFPRGGAGLLAAIPGVIFSMMGSEIAAIAAAETSDPVANITRAAQSVALRILTFYVLSISMIVLVQPWTNYVPGLSPFTSALKAMAIPGGERVMQVIVITAVLSCLNSGLYITSRMLFELSRKGDAPVVLASTAANKVPAAGLIVGCVAGFGAALAQIMMREDVFSLLASTSGDIILFIYALIACAQIRQRQALAAQGVVLRYKMWLFPWLSYLVIGGTGAILVLLGFDPNEQLTLLLSALTVVVALASLAVHRARRTGTP